MNREHARNLIKSTFTRAFDKSSFRTFAVNVLNRIDESKAHVWSTQYVKDAFKPHVHRYERLGTYTSPQKETLDVLIVHLTNESKLERARTAIRNFVADHLKTRDEKDAALVAFVSPTEQQWRFSYVKMDYATVQKESGKVGVETRLTPARRFSYLVGEGESSHTAQSRFLSLLQDTETDPALADIEEAFSVEAVTKEFFTKYAKLFEEIHTALKKLASKDKTLRDEFKAKNVSTVDFAKKLMGQIVFLYFIQKKGWLGVEKGKDWGTGPQGFLRRLEKREYGTYDNFFNDVLEPLFYDTLATDRGHEAWDKRFNCRIPFLNGGLFEPLGDYDWRKTDIILPNELFTNSEYVVKEDIIGTGVLDVFDRYNFTVNEAEPLEKEVAIDPEMLGKVFENLIEENRRKSLGAHYTPREIVHYMCQESLINYLESALNKDTVLVPREDIETFIHLGEQISHYESVEAKYAIKMPKSIERHARLIDEKLKEITVCDPAVGSGAFPVGMMTEIVRARRALTPYFNDVHERTAYHFKRHAIQNSLYGVDIDPSAVEITKLRLWLSLVVDEEETKQIKPLPNLDYKIMQGNSLIEEYEGIKLFDEGLIKAAPIELIEHIKHIKNKISSLQKLYIDLHSAGKLSKAKKAELDEQMKQQQSLLKQIQKGKDNDSENADLFDALSAAKKNWEELKKKHQQFFSSSNKTQKDDLRKRIANLELELIKATLEEQGKKSSIAKIEEHIRANTRPFFLWKLNFGEIFLSNSETEGGFDIVIGNPPYVRQEEIKEIKPMLEAQYACYTGVCDLYVYFYEKGINLLVRNGTLAYISSNKFFRAGYGQKLRSYLTANTIIRRMIDFGDRPVFEATTYPCVMVVSRSPYINLQENIVSARTIETIDELEHFEHVVQTSSIAMQQSDLNVEGWRIENRTVLDLLEKIKRAGVPLEEYVNGKIYRGIVTGFNDAFVIDGETKKRLIKEDKKSAEVIKPFLRGRDIKRYAIDDPGLFLLFIPWHFPLHENSNIEGASKEAEKEFKKQYPAVYGHLFQFKEQLESRNAEETGIRYEWYALQRCAASYWQELQKPKIVWGNLGELASFTFTNETYYASAPACIIPIKDLYLLAVLNSKVGDYYFHKTAAVRQGGYLEYKPMYVSQLPIVKPTESERCEIEELVQKMLDLRNLRKVSEDRQSNLPKVTELERVIDKLVYELYGLTKGEIAIVEGKA